MPFFRQIQQGNIDFGVVLAHNRYRPNFKLRKMKRLIKEAIKTIKEHPEKFIYYDARGKMVKLDDAAHKGISIKAVLVKTKAVEKLKKEGLDLSDPSVRNELRELLDLLDDNGNHLHKEIAPKVYSKDELTAKWFDYAMIDENANAEEFADEHHITLNTLSKWINEVKPK